MSAILKALKKIEQESNEAVGKPSFSKKFDAKKTINQRARKSWRLRRLGIASGFFLLLAAGTVFALTYGASFLKGPASSPQLSGFPGGGEINLDPPPPEQGKDRAGEEGQKTLLSQQKSGDTPSRISPPKPLPPDSPKPAAASTGRKAAVAPSPQGIERSEAEGDPVFQLQAVVWSDDPASCFVVINGRILRAKGTVEGATVTEISKEGVSLRKGDRVWRLRMLEGD